MAHLHLSGKDSRLLMRFEKAWHRAAQGMGIWEDRMFMLYDTGACAVYDIGKLDPKPLDVIKLGSYNEGTPTKDYHNHANDCMFSKTHYQGNPIPLLYVTIGTGIGADADGYFYRCAVENLTRTVDETGEHYHAETVQTISYIPDGIEDTPWMQPCWGCPAWLVDPDAGYLYMFSAKYRTKRGCVPEGEKNTYIITKFALPDVNQGGWVHLTPKDILDQFSAESDVPFTQGGTIYKGKLYYTFGCPVHDYPDTVLVFDLEKKCLAAVVDEMDEALNREEIECIAPYDGKMLVNTNGGFGIYVVQEGLFPL